MSRHIKEQKYHSMLIPEKAPNHRPVAKTRTFDCARCKRNRSNSTKRQVVTPTGRIECCLSCVLPGEKVK